MAGRQCSILSRVALFIAFAGIFSYVNFDRIRTWSAVNPEMSAYYRTIGAGYPLYAYHGDLSDLSRPGGADRTKLVPYFRDMQNDGGILITMSCLRIVFDRLGVLKNLQLNEYQLPFFAFLAMLA